MRNILLFSFLLVTLISVTESTANCPSCLMPCRNTPRASELNLFSSSVDSYTITAILDGYSGYFKIIISHNATGYRRLYSNEISVVYWLFDSLCRTLNSIPLITPVGIDPSKLGIQFKNFRMFYVYLKPSDDDLLEMFFVKVLTLQNELSTTKDALKALWGEFDERIGDAEALMQSVLNVHTQDAYSALISLKKNLTTIIDAHSNSIDEALAEMESKLNVHLQNERSALIECKNNYTTIIAEHSDFKSRLTKLENPVPKLNLHAKLQYAISNANITGENWFCKEGYLLSLPTVSGYCGTRNGSWVNIDLKEIFLINYIRFRLYDQDARVYTYSLQVSNSTTWVKLADNETGQSIQEYELDEGMGIRYIRMKGNSTQNGRLRLQSFAVDYI